MSKGNTNPPNRPRRDWDWEWKSTSCREEAIEVKINKSLAIYKNQRIALIRFINLYVSGTIPEGCKTSSIILDVAALLCPVDSSNPGTLYWSMDYFTKDLEDLIPTKFLTTDLYETSSLKKFYISCKKVLDSNPDDRFFELRHLCCFLALTFLRATVFNTDKMRGAFSEEWYTIKVGAMASQINYSPPCSTSIDKVVEATNLSKNPQDVQSFFAKIVDTWEIASDRRDTEIVKFLEDAVLNKTLYMYYGLTLLKIIKDITEYYRIPVSKLEELTLHMSTKESWECINNFNKKYQGYKNYPWARIICDCYFNELSMKKLSNQSLGCVLAPAFAAVHGNNGIYNSYWMPQRFGEDIKELGKKVLAQLAELAN